MGGHLLNGKAETGGLAAKALRADAQCIDGGKQLLLQLGVVGVGVGREVNDKASFNKQVDMLPVLGGACAAERLRDSQ